LNIDVARNSPLDGMSLVILEVEEEDHIYPEDGDIKPLRNIDNYIPIYTASYYRRLEFSDHSCSN